jgi:hypothetical protein
MGSMVLIPHSTWELISSLTHEPSRCLTEAKYLLQRRRSIKNFTTILRMSNIPFLLAMDISKILPRGRLRLFEMYVILRSIDAGDELIGQAELYAALAEEKTEKWSRTSLKLYCEPLTSLHQRTC